MSENLTGRVYLVEDDETVRLSLQAALAGTGYTVMGYRTAAEFLAQACLFEEGCVLLDLSLPDVGGLTVQQRLCDAGSTLAVVILTGTADVPAVVRAMQQGALTVVEKPFHPQTLVPLVAEALQKSRTYVARRQQQLAIEVRLAQLGEEERAVLDLMVAGLPIKGISLRLGLSTRTVERRRKAIMEKLAARSLVELGVLLGRYWQMTGRNGTGRSR